VPHLPPTGLAEVQRDRPRLPEPAADASQPAAAAEAPVSPARLANRLFIAALVANMGGYFGGGTYEVVWSLFLTSKGAGIGLIGLTFMLFSIPMLVVGPLAGRLVDRRGSLVFLVAGSAAVAICAPAYTLIPDPAWSLPLIVVESCGFAVINPALYAMVSRASPPGRSSTAQGLFGAAGTVGFVVASVITGGLAVIDLRYPFYLFGAVILGSLVLALTIGWREMLAGVPGRSAAVAPAAPVGTS
jgi:MFS family permease